MNQNLYTTILTIHLFYKRLFTFLGLLFITGLAQSQETTFTPNVDFTANNVSGLNGFDGEVNTTDDFFYNGPTAACSSGDQISLTITMTSESQDCEGDFSTAKVTIYNTSGFTLSNTLLNLDLSGSNAFFNGEPYNLTSGLVLAEPNIFDPNYPSVPYALSDKTGAQTLEIFTLPDGISSFDIEVVLGAPTTDLSGEVTQIPTNLNTSGATGVVSANVNLGVQPEVTLTCPGPVMHTETTISIPFTATGASNVTWRSGSDGTFVGGDPQVYNINDTDRANGFVEISVEAVSADGCLDLASCRIGISGSVYDFGDAPSSYDFGDTTLPVAAASTINPDIYLGSTPPGSENASTPTADATGDGPEEDGLNTTVINNATPGQTFTLTVEATNNDSTRPAYLNAFIDWNADGDFLGDEGEASQQVTVPADSGFNSYAVDFTVPTNVDPNLSDAIVRLRLSTDEFAAARTFGASANGEVEDHQGQFNVCFELNVHVYLEGALVDPGTGTFNTPPMRNSLNNSRLLPGQFSEDFIQGDVYSTPGQPYNVAPWNYSGTEGAGFDSGGSGTTNPSANYPATVVDWVLVSLRTTPEGSPLFQRAGLLNTDGSIDFVDDGECFDLDPAQSYYVVVEHRNHLIVMSDSTVTPVDGVLTYDFRDKQSFTDAGNPFSTNIGQIELTPGVFAMYAGNGNQSATSNADTDINTSDLSLWSNTPSGARVYEITDYNLNGDLNSNDIILWQRNTSTTTSVIRN